MSSSAALDSGIPLQLGTVTHAVEDLISGYEHLVKTLPAVSEQVKKAHVDTEALAKELEGRTKYLLQGFEYIQDISAQVPSLFHEAVGQQTRALLHDVTLILPDEAERMAAMQEQIDRLHLEVQSLAHQRTVIDVLSRPICNKVKRDSKMLQEDLFQQRSGGRSTSLPSTTAIDSPIPIPTYVSPAHRELEIKQAKSAKLLARNTAQTSLLPSQQLGLPEEVKRLHTKPTIVPGPGIGLKTQRKKKTSEGGSKVSSLALLPIQEHMQRRFSQTEEQLKLLQNRLQSTDKQVARERQKSLKRLQLVTQALQERQEWKDKALLQLVEGVVQECVDSMGGMVEEMEVVDIVTELLRSVPFVELEEHVHEAEPGLAELLEAWKAVQPPASQPAVPEPTASAKEKPAVPCTHIETQTEEREAAPPLPAPQPQPVPEQVPALAAPAALPTPAEPPVISFQPQIIVNVPPPPPPPATPSSTSSSPDKEVVDWMAALVQAYHADMQAQQAVMLALVTAQRERQADSPRPASPPPPGQGTDAVTQTEAVEEEKEEEEPPAAPAEPLSEETGQGGEDYRTCLGEVLLGGQPLAGPYAVTPKPSFQTECASRHLEAVPFLRKRASPLFLKAYQEVSLRQQTATGPPVADAGEKDTEETARWLDLCTLLARDRRPSSPSKGQEGEGGLPLTREDLPQVGHEQVHQAVLQALQYAAPTPAQPGPPPGPPPRPLPPPAQTASLSLDDVRREGQASRQQARRLASLSTASSSSAGMSLGESFHALYPSPGARERRGAGRPLSPASSQASWMSPSSSSSEASWSAPLPGPVLRSAFVAGPSASSASSSSSSSSLQETDPSPRTRQRPVSASRRQALQRSNQRLRDSHPYSGAALSSASSCSTSFSTVWTDDSSHTASSSSSSSSMSSAAAPPSFSEDRETEALTRRLVQRLGTASSAASSSSSSSSSMSSASLSSRDEAASLPTVSISSTESSTGRLRVVQAPLLSLAATSHSRRPTRSQPSHSSSSRPKHWR